MNESAQAELFSDDPRDFTGQKSRPSFSLPSSGPVLQFGRGGRLETVELQTEFLLPCEVGEGISWQGASAIHQGGGRWVCICPGCGPHVFVLGKLRGEAVVKFSAVVRALWSFRVSALMAIQS